MYVVIEFTIRVSFMLAGVLGCIVIASLATDDDGEDLF